jgi:protein ImuB
MPVAEARAIESNLVVVEEDLETDRRALECLAHWADRFSPIVGLEDEAAPQSLLIDITGCASCFHGEDTLLARANLDFSEAGWFTRIAIADTIGAAWALAHHGQTPYLAPVCSLERELRDLPVAALRLPFDIVQVLARLGIERVDGVLGLPRNEVPARLGPLVLQRLDQALGRQQELVVSQRAPQAIESAIALEYPTDRLDLLNSVLDSLTNELEPVLEARHCAARQVECALYQLTEAPLYLQVGLFRPRRCPQYLGNLLRGQLERMRFNEPIRAVRLRVVSLEPVIDKQSEFFATEPGGMEAAAPLVDYLSNRMGADALTQAQLVPDFQPEFACRFEPMIQPKRERAKILKLKPADKRRLRRERRPSSAPFRPMRPLCLWPRPVGVEVLSVIPDGPPFRIRWAGQEYRIERARGPERIETGWWRGGDVRRDYYVVDTDRGTRLWIFRSQADGRWFLHGCFD